MIKIENTKLEYLDRIENIAHSSDEYLVPNNRMIYYLCCTIFSKYSYVALNDGIPIGYLFSIYNSESNSHWLHQIAVIQNKRKQGIGSQLLFELENAVFEDDKDNKTVRCAIKMDNLPSINFFKSHNYKSHGIDPYIDMGIFEKYLNYNNNKL